MALAFPPEVGVSMYSGSVAIVPSSVKVKAAMQPRIDEEPPRVVVYNVLRDGARASVSPR